MPSRDPVAALGETDPKQVSEEDLVRLLEAASERARTGQGGDLSALSAEQFARLISRASNAQLEAVVAREELRRAILDEVFRRMSEHYKAETAKAVEAVVRWRIGSADDDYLRYECVLSGGTCTLRDPTGVDARATITLRPAEFLKLASGNASPPTLFMKGKLNVAGDLAFAAGLTKLFQIPRA